MNGRSLFVFNEIGQIPRCDTALFGEFVEAFEFSACKKQAASGVALLGGFSLELSGEDTVFVAMPEDVCKHCLYVFTLAAAV